MDINVANQAATFSMTDTKFDFLVVTWPTQDNKKLLEQLKFGFKKHLTGIHINQKYQQKDKINI